jgi:hypothetical protein
MRPHVILPTQANLRFQRRMTAIALVVAAVSIFLGLALIHYGTATRGQSPVALIVGTIGSIGLLVGVRRSNAKLERQARQLASYGRRFPARRVGTDLMRRGSITHWHVVVAEWVDAKGETHEAISDPFDYDPAPLLERGGVEVLADPFHPGLALVLESGLPPRKWIRLDREQRQRVRAHGPLSPFLLWIAPKLLLGFVFGTLAYFVLKLVDTRFDLVDWL